MKMTNRLTLGFLREHPQDAAQVLEQLPLDMRLSLLEAVPEEDAASLLEFLLPASAGACLQAMTAEQAGGMLSHTSIPCTARILATMNRATGQRVLQQIPKQHRQRIRQSLRHPAATVGSIMETDYFVLPQDITVTEAIKRVERSDKSISGEVYVVGPAFRLVGMIALDTLFKAGRQLSVRSIMEHDSASLAVHARIKTLPSRQEWQQVRSLPVVDAEGVVIGLLDYGRLLQAVGETALEQQASDAFASMMSIAGLYWLAIAQLIDAVITRRPRKAARSTREGT